MNLMMTAVAVDLLALRYRAAYDKMNGGREQWIDGTLELAVVVAELRDRYPDHREFSRWLARHGFEQVHPNDRAALIGFSRDLAAGRKMLEESRSTSWRGVWEKRPKRTLTKIGKGTQLADQAMRRAPASPMSCANRVPPSISRGLTREQVDPDFKGHAVGVRHQVRPCQSTNQDRDRTSQAARGAVGAARCMTDHERSARALLGGAPNHRPDRLAGWQQIGQGGEVGRGAHHPARLRALGRH